MFLNMSTRFPLIIVSLNALVIWPFSMKKLFFATPEKSPFVLGWPPENLLRRIPRSTLLTRSLRLVSPVVQIDCA